jgi:hypothetical protein
LLPVAGFLLLNGCLAQLLGPDQIIDKFLLSKRQKKRTGLNDLSALRLLLKQGNSLFSRNVFELRFSKIIGQLV